MAIKPVEILIKAKDEASGVFGFLRRNAVELGVTIAGYFGVKAFAGAVQGAAELEGKLSEVKAVSGATADEMQRLRAAAEQAGATTRYTATEAAGALGNLSRAGLDANQSIAALPGTLALAQAGNIGLEESASIVTRALAGFGLQAENSGLVADVLAKGANSANTNVLGLAQALSYAAPTAQGLGLSLETTVAIIGKFADAGIDASRAGTALNAILAQFADPASRFRKELAAIGITTNDFEEALRQMAAAGPGAQKALLAVGTEAGPAMRAFLSQGIGAFDELKNKLLEAEGAAKATADTMEDNLQGATRGLGSAWDTVKNALATPVLPVLKDGVTQLAGALRDAVSDGTVGKFGTAIASGFQSALTWARSFLAEVDFDALSARVSGAADRVGAAFVTVETYARNAGNVVSLVWGVMSAGANTILAVVYTVGEAFAGVASNIQSGVALILQGLSKITFGDVSANFKAAAEDMRVSAEATWAASEALADKARQSFLSMSDGAELARQGWAGLTEGSAEATAQAATSARVFEQVGETLKEVGGDATAMGQKAQAAAVLQTEAARQTREEVQALKREYEAAMQAGDVQTAVLKLQQMQAALKGTGAQATATGQEIAAAFERMGVQSRAELERTAQNALRDFTLIKDSGQATAAGLQQAWRQYAEAAIAANGGVATETLKAQAAVQGLEITVDAAGKTIVRAMGEGVRATESFGSGVQKAAEEVKGLMAWLDRLEKRNAEVKSKLVTDKDGFSLDKDGKRLAMGGDLNTLTGITNFLKQAGLNEEQAKGVAREFADSKGNVQYFNNPGQIKYGGRESTISEALLKAAERITFGLGDAGGGSIGRTVSVNINTPGGRETVNTDEAGAQALVRSLQQASLVSRG